MKIPLPAAQNFVACGCDARCYRISKLPQENSALNFAPPAPRLRRGAGAPCLVPPSGSLRLPSGRCQACALSPSGTPAALRSTFVAPQAFGFLGPTPKPRLVLLRGLRSPLAPSLRSGAAGLLACSASPGGLASRLGKPALPGANALAALVFPPPPRQPCGLPRASRALAVSLRSSGSLHAWPAARRWSPFATPQALPAPLRFAVGLASQASEPFGFLGGSGSHLRRLPSRASEPPAVSPRDPRSPAASPGLCLARRRSPREFFLSFPRKRESRGSGLPFFVIPEMRFAFNVYSSKAVSFRRSRAAATRNLFTDWIIGMQNSAPDETSVLRFLSRVLRTLHRNDTLLQCLQ